ncbi:MAG: hypothetical protein ACOYIR_00800 [Christensenellales bacterium]|jgi:RNA-binding protein YlmH
MAEWIAENLSRVGRQSVQCAVLDRSPEGPLYNLLEHKIQISSERVDAIVAKTYRLSRNQSAELFHNERVFVDAAVCKNASRQLNKGEIVSVRGFGRFVYGGVTGRTKKGRLNAILHTYC